MAIFGFQLCFTLIMASFLQKLMPIYSFGRWILCNGSLIRYLHPTDKELKKIAGKPIDKTNGKSRNRKNKNIVQENKTFKVSKKIDITLDAAAISHVDTLGLRNFVDFEWLVNYTCFGILIYIATELYYETAWAAKHEFNISIVWLILSMWFAIKNLLSVLWLYAKSKAGGELSMSIAFGMFSFVVSLAVLMVKEEVLEFGIEAYTTQNVTQLNNTSFIYTRHFSINTIKLTMAGLSSIFGLLFAFPAIRLAQMYIDALQYANNNKLMQLILHINFYSPLAIAILWVRPIVRQFIRDPYFSKTEESIPLITDSQFDIARISFILLICVLRVVLIRTHLQAYLNLAYHRVLRLRKEPGMIVNTDLQKLIAQVYYYLGIIAMQYLSPVVLLMCCTLCLKTLGGYSWIAFAPSYHDDVPSGIAEVPVLSFPSFLSEATFNEIVTAFGANFLNIKTVLTPLLLRGIFSYIVWWSAFNWFMASCLGLVYHSYLAS